MTTLTILNTILIFILLFKTNLIRVKVERDTTFFKKTLIGYHLWIQGYYFRVPVRNKRKTELKEDIERMMSLNKSGKLQNLSAMFSWLKTQEEVEQFKKNYSIVDEEIIDQLVANFKPK